MRKSILLSEPGINVEWVEVDSSGQLYFRSTFEVEKLLTPDRREHYHGEEWFIPADREKFFDVLDRLRAEQVVKDA